MDKHLLTEKEVLEKLQIKKFKKMPKEKIAEFTSLITEMETDVAKTALSQYPHFTNLSIELVNSCKEIYSSAIKENSKSMDSFYKSCDDVLEILKSMLDKKIGKKERRYLIEQIMEIVKLQNQKDNANKEWLTNIVKILSKTAISLACVVGAIIGLKGIRNRKL